MGILLFVLKNIYISLLLKMINGFSRPAKIMVSPFKTTISFNSQVYDHFLTGSTPSTVRVHPTEKKRIDQHYSEDVCSPCRIPETVNL